MKPKLIAKITTAPFDETRLQIYSGIAREDEVNCGDICSLQSVGGPSVSHHLCILSEAGLVDSRRQGQFVYYGAIQETIEQFSDELLHMASKKRTPGKA